ncbi:hypothetical protein [Cellulosimicrobium arenosum]|uniref:Uncharacterized protein n=1 Tax=Cellulosimicrobium arenosum TaxID=2708133 RepID=A0A927G843_9MICO|nr:hypothetical protein [Cellulosimicrobium arenosum]MBD8078643.1 hypothetical protein [Cellulosimicrobium arenosum]
MGWREGYPAEGDLSGLVRAESVLGTAMERSDELVQGLTWTGQAVAEVWTGAPFDAWAERVQATSAWCTQMYEIADTARRAVAAYVSGVDELVAEHAAICLSIEDVESRARAAGVPVEADLAWMTVRRGMFAGVGTGVESGTGSGATGPAPLWTVEAFEDELWGLVEQVQGLAERRRALDTRLRDTVAGVVPAGWAARREVFAAAGVSEPRKMTPVVLAQALAGQVSSGPTATDEVLQAFFDEYGTQEQVMSAFFIALGGRGTLGLMDGGGGQYDDVQGKDLELVRAVRAGFAVGSAGWRRERAEVFADGLFGKIDPSEDPRTSGWAIVTLATLFEGPPYAGEQVAVAVADRLDELDRRWPVVADGYMLGPHAVLEAERKVHGLRVLNDTGSRSPANAILRTLAQYPQTASDWLVAAPHGGRVEHWFGAYAWGDRGGFDGPLALLSATQDPSVRGVSASDGEVVLDLVAMERAARLASRGLTGLVENPTWRMEELNAAECVLLADVINANWVAIHTRWTDREATASSDDAVISGKPEFARTEDRLPLAQFEPDVVTRMFGAAGLTDEGQARLQQGYREFVGASIYAASVSGIPVTDQVREVQNLMSVAVERIEGSEDWARLDVVGRAAQDASSNAATTLLLLGILASGVPTAGATWAIAMGAGIGLSALTLQTSVDARANERIAGVEDDTKAGIDARYRAELTGDLTVAAALLDVPLPPHPSTLSSPFSASLALSGPPTMTEDLWLDACTEAVNDEYARLSGAQPGSQPFDVSEKAWTRRTDQEGRPNDG